MSGSTEKVRTISGKVVSTKMDKTITVLVERMVRHPVYGKYVRKSTKLMAHDEDNRCKEGDSVTVVSCRPVSRNKTWMLHEIVETAK